MPDKAIQKEIEILSKKELDRTIKRLASQILEKIPDISSLLLVGIPTSNKELVSGTFSKI